MRHLKTLLFAQFSGLSSLRELCDGMAAQPASLYHLGLRLPRRSTLCDALSQRPAGVFRDICGGLLGQAQRAVRREGAALIQLLDASPIMILDQRSAWAERDKHTRGLKLHIGSDPRETLLDWVVTSPRISDIKAARAVPITSGTTYGYDKPVLSACKAVEGGRSENAVKTQINVALIAFLLLRLFRAAILPTGNLKALLTRLKTALFAPFSLTNHTKPPPQRNSGDTTKEFRKGIPGTLYPY